MFVWLVTLGFLAVGCVFGFGFLLCFAGLLGLVVGGFPWVLVLCRVLVRFVASGFWFVGLIRGLVV